MNNINKKCPECNELGKGVLNSPVKNLVVDDKKSEVNESIYFLCMNEDCDISYFNNENNSIFTVDDLRYPLWFKKDASPKYICYCSKTTEEEIVDAIERNNARTVEDVMNITGAMKDSDCKNNNPLGKCCSLEIRKILEEYI